MFFVNDVEKEKLKIKVNAGNCTDGNKNVLNYLNNCHSSEGLFHKLKINILFC